ncbi:hypothetical protein BH11PLA2_BH11PLA2_20100 [soil metagenome]
MPTAPAKRPLDPAWSAPVLYITLGILFAAIPIYKSVTRENNSGNKDYTLWYEIGNATRAGEPLYEARHNNEVKYLYPPPMAVLVYSPLSLLGPTGFVTAIAVFTAAMWAACVALCLILMTDRWKGHARWLYVVPGLAVASYMWDLQILGQVNMVLLAMTLTAMLLVRRGHGLSAGLFLGTAIAIKGFPLPAIAYFIVRRQWTAVASTLASTVLVVFLLPAAVRGFERTAGELQLWTQNMIGDQSGNAVGARTSVGYTRRNQSLVSVSHRLLRDVHAGPDPEEQGRFTVNFANVSPKTAQLVGFAACFGLGLVLLVTTRMKFAPTPLAEGLEVAMVTTLVILCSPISWTYFFCWLLPAWTAVMICTVSPQLSAGTRKVAWSGAILAAVLLVSAVTEQIDPTLQSYGVTAWGTVTLFLTMAYARWTLPNAVAVEAETPLPMKLAA